MKRIPRLADEKYEFGKINFGQTGWANLHGIVESLELHRTSMPFRCEKCKKEFPVGTHYIGSGGYDKTCPDCAEYRFEKVKEYIKALKVIGKFHKQILKKFQKEIATANISAKL